MLHSHWFQYRRSKESLCGPKAKGLQIWSWSCCVEVSWDSGTGKIVSYVHEATFHNKIIGRSIVSLCYPTNACACDLQYGAIIIWLRVPVLLAQPRSRISRYFWGNYHNSGSLKSEGAVRCVLSYVLSISHYWNNCFNFCGEAWTS